MFRNTVHNLSTGLQKFGHISDYDWKLLKFHFMLLKATFELIQLKKIMLDASIFTNNIQGNQNRTNMFFSARDNVEMSLNIFY